MSKWLQNNYVIITGASGGIGRELTKILICRYGAKVIGIGRSEEKMQALRRELNNYATSFSYRLFDVAQKEAWAEFRDELLAENISPILLINNAGVFPPLQKTIYIYPEIIEQTLQTNFLSAVYAVDCISPLLRGNQKCKPAIVNVCSSAALCTVVGTAAYSASKSAMKGYTEALQLEERDKKYVGIIYPGTTATDLFRNDDNVRRSAMQKIATSPTKMAKKIAKTILRRKKRAVLGWDAKFMCLTAKLLPVKGPAFIRWVMKLSKSKAFDNVFDEKE